MTKEGWIKDDTKLPAKIRRIKLCCTDHRVSAAAPRNRVLCEGEKHVSGVVLLVFFSASHGDLCTPTSFLGCFSYFSHRVTSSFLVASTFCVAKLDLKTEKDTHPPLFLSLKKKDLRRKTRRKCCSCGSGPANKTEITTRINSP